MIYSQWIPDRGGYAYFESPERFGLNDNLGTPALVEVRGIGAPSTDAGRTPSGRLSPKGQGPLPVGSILPLTRTGLHGTSAQMSGCWWFGAACVALGVYYLWRRNAHG